MQSIQSTAQAAIQAAKETAARAAARAAEKQAEKQAEQAKIQEKIQATVQAAAATAPKEYERQPIYTTEKKAAVKINQSSFVAPKTEQLKQQFNTQGKFDKHYSTYMHEIHLDMRHPDNTKPLLTGYSKNIGYPEPADKEYVLKQVIYRIFLKYQPKIIAIDFYRKEQSEPDFSYATKILTLYPNDYDYLLTNYYTDDLNHFLKQMYEKIKKAHPISNLQPKRQRIGKTFEDVLNVYLNNKTFLTYPEVKKFCITEIANGRPAGMLQHFHDMYCDSHFSKEVSYRYYNNSK